MGRDAEHVADDDHRQRCCDVAYEVALAAFAHCVDDRVARLAQVLFAVTDAVRREAAIHEFPALPVLGVVEVDHRRHPAVGPTALPTREGRRISRRAEHRLVGGESPDPVLGVEVHRGVGAHPLVLLARISGVKAAVE